MAETRDGYVSFSNLAILISGSNWHFLFTVTSPPGNFSTVCFIICLFYLKNSPFSFVIGIALIMSKESSKFREKHQLIMLLRCEKQEHM